MAQKGHKRKRGSTWSIWYDLPRAGGKRRLKCEGGFPTAEAAQRALNDRLKALDDHEFIEPTKVTVGQFLVDEWVPAVERRVRAGKLKESTARQYRDQVLNHLVPRIGDVQLRALTVTHLDTLYDELLAHGRLRDGGPLAPRSVEIVHTVIHSALNFARKRNMVRHNVADLAEPPKGKKKEMEVWTPGQTKQFLTSSVDHPLHTLFFLAATTGMRRGELAGLRWSDVNLDDGYLDISNTRTSVGYEVLEGRPKSKKSERRVALDAATVTVLRAHKASHAAARLAATVPFNPGDYVFVKDNGLPLHPESVSRQFKRAYSRLDLPPVRLHDIRHGHASAGLLAGIPAKVMADRLGHSSVSVTLDIYSHVLPEQAKDAAEEIAGIILGAPTG
ncbi:MAG: site-specific integrase [Microthrixaceae bacterium]|nr:site-specific integrase [Microthrixaceae bacterium]